MSPNDEDKLAVGTVGLAATGLLGVLCSGGLGTTGRREHMDG